MGVTLYDSFYNNIEEEIQNEVDDLGVKIPPSGIDPSLGFDPNATVLPPSQFVAFLRAVDPDWVIIQDYNSERDFSQIVSNEFNQGESNDLRADIITYTNTSDEGLIVPQQDMDPTQPSTSLDFSEGMSPASFNISYNPPATDTLVRWNPLGLDKEGIRDGIVEADKEVTKRFRSLLSENQTQEKYLELAWEGGWIPIEHFPKTPISDERIVAAFFTGQMPGDDEKDLSRKDLQERWDTYRPLYDGEISEEFSPYYEPSWSQKTFKPAGDMLWNLIATAPPLLLGALEETVEAPGKVFGALVYTTTGEILEGLKEFGNQDYLDWEGGKITDKDFKEKHGYHPIWDPFVAHYRAVKGVFNAFGQGSARAYKDWGISPGGLKGLDLYQAWVMEHYTMPMLKSSREDSENMAFRKYAADVMEGNITDRYLYIMQAVTSPLLTTGIGIATGVLTGNPVLAMRVAQATAFAFEATNEYTQAVDYYLSKGYTYAEAAKAATAGALVYGAAASLTERLHWKWIGDMPYVSKVAKKLKGTEKVRMWNGIARKIVEKIPPGAQWGTAKVTNMLISAGTESIEEGLQTYEQALVQTSYREVDWSEVYDEAATSSEMGGVGGFFLGLLPGKGTGPAGYRLKTMLSKAKQKTVVIDKAVIDGKFTKAEGEEKKKEVYRDTQQEMLGRKITFSRESTGDMLTDYLTVLANPEFVMNSDWMSSLVDSEGEQILIRDADFHTQGERILSLLMNRDVTVEALLALQTEDIGGNTNNSGVDLGLTALMAFDSITSSSTFAQAEKAYNEIADQETREALLKEILKKKLGVIAKRGKLIKGSKETESLGVGENEVRIAFSGVQEGDIQKLWEGDFQKAQQEAGDSEKFSTDDFLSSIGITKGEDVESAVADKLEKGSEDAEDAMQKEMEQQGMTAPAIETAEPAPVEDIEKLSNTQLNKKIKELGLEDEAPKTKKGKISFTGPNKEKIINLIKAKEAELHKATQTGTGQTMHTGGAQGADTEFQKEAEAKGMDVKAHSFKGHGKGNKKRVEHSEEELKEADTHLAKANRTLKRRVPTKKKYVRNLLRRNYFQVKDSDQVIAVSIIKDGQVEGGTAWATQIAIDMGKSVSVFDMNTNKWHKWDGTKYVESEAPTLSESFAGVGSRNLTAEGKQAIKELFNPKKTTVSRKAPVMEPEEAPEGLGEISEDEFTAAIGGIPIPESGKTPTKAPKKKYGSKNKVVSTQQTSEVEIQDKQFNPDIPEGNSYPIRVDGKYAGVITVDNDGRIMSSIGMAGMELEPEFRKKGLGKKSYIALNDKLNVALKSENKNSLNEDSEGVWKSLVRSNLAEDKGNYYEFKPTQQTSEVETYKGLKVINSLDITNAEGQKGAAAYDRVNNLVKVNRKLLTTKFKEKAWTNMRELIETIHGKQVKSKAENLPANSFNTYKEFEMFVIEHEYQHSLYSRKDFNKKFPDGTKGEYETAINNRALDSLAQQTSEVEKGISDLFESNPELANIGSQEQYSQYLDTVGGKQDIKGFKEFVSPFKAEQPKDVEGLDLSTHQITKKPIGSAIDEKKTTKATTPSKKSSKKAEAVLISWKVAQKALNLLEANQKYIATDLAESYFGKKGVEILIEHGILEPHPTDPDFYNTFLWAAEEVYKEGTEKFTPSKKKVSKKSTAKTGLKGIALEEVSDKIEETPLRSEEDRKLEKKIQARLKKKMPFVSPIGRNFLVGAIMLGGKFINAQGIAIANLMGYTSKRGVQTIPHEHFHIYWGMLKGQPIEKKMTKLFLEDAIEYINKKGIDKNREYLTTDSKIVEEYLARITSTGYVHKARSGKMKRIQQWLNTFYLKAKQLFGKATKDDILEILSEDFYNTNVVKPSIHDIARWKYEAATYYEDNLLETDLMLEETEDNIEKLSSSAIGKHITHYFNRAFGIMLKKEDTVTVNNIAIVNKNSFVDFRTALQAHLQDNYKEFDSEKFLSKDTEKYLRKLFNKSLSQMPYWSVKNGHGRLYFELVQQSTKEVPNGEWSIEILGHDMQPENGVDVLTVTDVSRKDGRKLPVSVMRSFPEQDPTYPRTIHISRKDILKHSMFGDKEWMSENNLSIDAETIKSMDQMYITMYDEGGDHLFAFVGSKAGTSAANSSIYLVRVDDALVDLTQEEFLEYYKGEVALGNMTQEIADAIIEETIELESDMGLHVYGIRIAKHEWWQATKYPRYLLGSHIDSVNHSGESQRTEHSVLDSFNRLRIDYPDAYTVYNMKKTKLMTMSTDTEVWMNGELVGTIDEFDGWMMASKRVLRMVGDLTGVDKMRMFKGIIRSRSEGGKDYLGTKSMAMEAFDNMEFRSPEGEIIAEYNNNHFVDANGNDFDWAMSTNEAKQTEGKFSELNTIQELEGDYLKINKTPDKSKKTAAFPVSWPELILDPTFRENEDLKAFLKEVKAHYDTVANEYLDLLYGFRDDPKSLHDFLVRAREENQLPTELDEYIDLLEDGVGLNYPTLLNRIVPQLNNVLLNEGLWKGRQLTKGNATQLYLKPKTDLKIDKGTIKVSADNKTLFKLAWKKFTDSQGVIKNLSKEVKVDLLNAWLKDNDVSVLVSRQPVAKFFGTVTRRITEFVPGHGEAVFCTAKDVLKIFDGDWDGDTLYIENVSSKFIEALNNLQNSEAFKNRDKAVDLKYFAKRVEGTSLGSYEDTLKAVSRLSQTEGAIGMIQNAKTLLANLNWKESKFTFENKYGVEVTVVPYGLEEEVIMDYVTLIGLDEKGYKAIIKMGDDVVDKNGEHLTVEQALDSKTEAYLKTTKEHEFAILLQMAVDDTRFGLLASFEFDQKFLIDKMYSTEEGSFDAGVNKSLRILNKALGLSKRRQGKNQDRSIATMEDNFVMSQNLYLMLTSNDIGKQVKQAYYANVPKSGYGLYDIVDVEMQSGEEYITPMEQLLISLEERKRLHYESYERSDVEEWLDKQVYDKIPMKVSEEVAKMARIEAGVEIIETMDKIDISGYTFDSETVKNALNVFDQMNVDYQAVFHQLMQESKSEKEVFFIKPDYEERIQEVIEEWKSKFDTLTESEQILGTLYHLGNPRGINDKGKMTRMPHLLNLMPLALMNKKAVKFFLNKWAEKVDNSESWILHSSGPITSGGVKFSRNPIGDILRTILNYTDGRYC